MTDTRSRVSETPEPISDQRPATRRGFTPILRWATVGATVLALGVGGALIATNSDPSFAQAGPTATPQFGRPGFGGPGGPGGQRQPGGGMLLGVMARDGQNGAEVVRLMPGSAAEKAGIQTGDVITAVDGQAVNSVQDLRDRLNGKQPGNTVSVTIRRNNATSNVNVTLAAPTFQPGAMGPGGPNQGGQGQGQGGRGGHRGPGGHGFGFGFDVLQNVPADQRFSHMLGSQTSILDANNVKHTYLMIPGKVVAASATSLTIQPNDNTLSGGPYTINSNTHVRGVASVDQLKAGDNVIVNVEAGTTTARAVMAMKFDGAGRPGGPGGPGSRPRPSATPTR